MVCQTLRAKNVPKLLFSRLIKGIVSVKGRTEKLKMEKQAKFNDFFDYSESNDCFVPIEPQRKSIKCDPADIMTVRFFPPPFPSFFCVLCVALCVNVSGVCAADYVGPVFPEDSLVIPEISEPLPLPMPKRSSLLQRPVNKQVVFDDLDPVGSVIQHGVLDDEGIDFQPPIDLRGQRQRQISFTNDGETFQGEILGDFSFSEGSFDMDGCVAGPFLVPFGMGLFDNVSFFSEATSFKTALNEGAGSIGLSEGINWSAAVTPQGAATAQYGVRGVQGDLFDLPARTQLFMTAGIFKRFEFASVQGGVAVDWLQDTSRQFKTVNLQQLRCELSFRAFSDVECGFMGGFGVFGNLPTRGNRTVDVRDHYLLFVRQPLACGGQAEMRSGASERGEVIMGVLGEVAINDRLSVNGGITMLCPTGGQSQTGNLRESWCMTMGAVLYFRGGATCRQINSHRPMFDVAGNNSFFTKVIGK